MTKELAGYFRGWKGHFGHCQTPSVPKSLDDMDSSLVAIHDLEAVETRGPRGSGSYANGE